MTLAGGLVTPDCRGLCERHTRWAPGCLIHRVPKMLARVRPTLQGPLRREPGRFITLLIKLNSFIKCQGSRLVLPPAVPAAEACAGCASQEPGSPNSLGPAGDPVSVGGRPAGRPWLLESSGRVKRFPVCSVATRHFTCSAACEEQ